MYFYLGRPESLAEIRAISPDILSLKRAIAIAILDDEPFIPSPNLQRHGFHLEEIGGDIKSLTQVESYPIIVCDIQGVGTAFSESGGAHVISELRKNYPDKYLIAYTGLTHNINVQQKTRSADAFLAKDASIDIWLEVLERGLRQVADPIQRWLRMRRNILEGGVEIFDAMNMERAYIASIKARNKEAFEFAANRIRISPEIRDLLLKFSATALAQIIESTVLGR